LWHETALQKERKRKERKEEIVKLNFIKQVIRLKILCVKFGISCIDIQTRSKDAEHITLVNEKRNRTISTSKNEESQTKKATKKNYPILKCEKIN
jgi:hypothetical protein